MKALRSSLLALAFFSKLPMPSLDWSEDNMRYLPAAFPLVGLLTGLLLQAWLWISQWMGLGHLLFAAGLTLIPVGVTGGIHLDGFCDTADALASRAPMEKKQAILADPRTGAFAIISLLTYMMAYWALASELAAEPKTLMALGLIHILCRILVGLGLVYFPAAKKEGFFASIARAARKGPVTVLLGLLFVLCSAGLVWTSGWPGLLLPGLALLQALYMNGMSKKHFGGMNGDLAGYWLQMTELLLLAGLVFLGKGFLS